MIVPLEIRGGMPFVSARLTLLEYAPFDESFEWDLSGLRLAAGRILEVEGVVKGSPGEEVRVRVGDVLVRIDGMSLSPEDLGEVRKRLMGDGEVILTFERNGETLEKTLSLRRLI
jgi:C-terminal processing protease CtpA/Prc